MEGEATRLRNGVNQGFFHGYRHAETFFLAISATGKSLGLLSNNVPTTVPTTETCIECNHGNQVPIDKRIPSNPAPPLIDDAEKLDEIEANKGLDTVLAQKGDTSSDNIDSE